MRQASPIDPTIQRLAAQYVRMSTDGQELSIYNQIDAIREFAEAKGLRLVRTYADAGISGLTLENRPGLKRLLDDIAAENAPFGVVLVWRLASAEGPDLRC